MRSDSQTIPGFGFSEYLGKIEKLGLLVTLLIIVEKTLYFSEYTIA